MQVSSRLLVKTAIIMLAVLMAAMVFVVLTQAQQAKALTSTQWDTVRGYVNSYFNGQTAAVGGDESGIVKLKLDLMHQLGGDTGTGVDDTLLTSYLGEGDDMANRPVLLDNLMTQTNDLPGTEFRCNWNVDNSCFAQTSVDMVKTLVDKHREAGFATDIVDYCVSSHTASPVTAGWGAIAQTGALSSDGSVPIVRELQYSRNGWTNTSSGMTFADGGRPIASPETSAGGFSPTFPTQPTECETATSDADLVRCSANWAIASTKGNVGNGNAVVTAGSAVDTAGQSIDVRPGSIQTMDTAGTNLQLPLDVLFSSAGLAQIDPLQNLVVASNTQHGGQAAMALRMLGYTTIPGGYINGGIGRWNYATGATLWAPIGDALPKQTVSALSAPALVDTTPPTVSSVSAATTGPYTADVSRSASEPATTKIDLAGSDGSVVHVNNTVLHADDTENLTGLHDGVTYTGTLTAYDAFANGTSTAISFSTPSACTGSKPALSIRADWAFWGSYADYTAGNLTVKYTVSNIGTENATGVAISGATATNGVTLVSGAGSLGNIAAAGSVSANLVYNVPTGVSQFYTTISGSAQDHCGATYTYP